MITAVLLAATLAAPMTLTSGTGGERPSAPILKETAGAEAMPAGQPAVRFADSGVDPTDPERDPGFVDKYLGLMISPSASPQVKDSQIISLVMGYLFWPVCGNLWGPIAFTADSEFSGDAVLTWFVSGLIWVIISSAASLTGVGALLFLAFPYFTTTAVLNELDRGIKRRGLAGEPAKKPTPGNQPAAPPDTGDAPPPSYAY